VYIPLKHMLPGSIAKQLVCARLVFCFAGEMTDPGEQEGAQEEAGDDEELEFVFEDWSKDAGLKRITVGFLRT
jgi:hypothetical protein